MIRKISIIGAGGVGSNLAFNILSRLQISELVLLDINKDRAEAVACDLEDTRGFLDFATRIKAAKRYSQIKDSDIIIFTAGTVRKKGMNRQDLLKINGSIARESARQIRKYSPRSIIVAVTNPLDIITYLILKETGFSWKKVFGMGSSLDSGRLLHLLFEETGIAAGSQQAFVFGPHSKDMILYLEKESRFYQKEKHKEISHKVRFRGAKIVELHKNKSAVFGPAAACCRLIEAIAFDKNQIIPVSVLLRGEYRIKNVCLGMPCVVGREGVVRVIEKKLLGFQKKKLKQASLSFRQALKNL